MNKYNLIDVLSKQIEIEGRDNIERHYFNGIQIPMIQRDYAQGREEEFEVRRRFLKAIFDSLEKNEKLELDFVYGSIKELDKKEFFIPLDGQQRLTTLFLLYWYIGNKELNDYELDELRNILKRFTYATRTTSRKFCEKLSEIRIGFLKTPSEEIKESIWFFDSFEKDPTVKAMLIMLDAIHQIYGNSPKSIYPNLSKLNFYILPLDGFDLSDELYIKMNARGKQLTDFENFKADLIKWLKDDKNPWKSEFQEKININGRTMPYYLSIGLKLDNDWTNLFWAFTKKKMNSKEKLVDSYFLEFWNRHLLNTFIVHSNLSQESIEKEALFQKFYGSDGNNELFKYQNFDFYKIIFEQKGFIKRAELTLDKLSKNIELIEKIIKPNWEEKSDWSLFSKEINQRQRVLFFAVTKYLEHNDFDATKFKNWIRVVWNIIVDPNLRRVPTMIASIRLIQQLSTGSSDIYGHLNNSIDLDLIEKNPQLKHERIKAIFINAESRWEPSIIEAESHPMFKGSIRFLFPEQDNTNFKKFIEFKNAAFRIFSKEGGILGIPKNYVWLRAVLSKTKNISLPITLANGGFDNWNLLINNQLLAGTIEVLSFFVASNDETTEILKLIINNYCLVDNKIWLYKLVKWEDKNGKCLLDYSETKTVREYKGYHEDIQEIYLFNKTIWSEGNIIISNYRNEIISELLKCSMEIKCSPEEVNIQNEFFRGWNIRLSREVRGFNFTYLLDREFLRIGIISNQVSDEKFKNLRFGFEEKELGWICRKKYDFTIIRPSEIKCFIEQIEKDIFNESNPDSLVEKLLVPNQQPAA